VEGKRGERVGQAEGDEAGNVLQQEDLWSKYPHRRGDVGPQVARVIGTPSLSGQRVGRAGRPRHDHVDLGHVQPVDLRDVTQVEGVRPVVGQDRDTGRIGLGVPGHLAAEDLLGGQVQAPVAAAE
jgi:hypothetical protein